MADEPVVQEPEEPSRTISRRTIIKRGAIIGGIAWVAPMIATTPAFAQTGSNVHACCACVCPGPRTVCQTDHTALPGLASPSDCANYCASQGTGCVFADYKEGTHGWSCTSATGGTPTCQPA